MLPLINVDAARVPDRVLVVGDPARVRLVAGRLEDVEELGSNREYLTMAGTYRGRRIGIASHGVGSAGAAICFEELCQAGVKRLIRAGTCGGIQDDVNEGDLVVVTSAVRREGLTQRLVPLGYPAAANVDVVLALRNAATARAVRFHEGITVTDDLFYSHAMLGNEFQFWHDAGVKSYEMEISALYVVASLNNVQAGAIITVDANNLKIKELTTSTYDPHRTIVRDGVEKMIDVALDALVA
jgi:uridine phosphorylase